MKKSELRRLVKRVIKEQGPRPYEPGTAAQTTATGTSGGNTGGGDELSRETAAELKRNADLLSQAMSGTNRAKWYQFRQRLALKINQMIIDFLGDAGII